MTKRLRALLPARGRDDFSSSPSPGPYAVEPAHSCKQVRRPPGKRSSTHANTCHTDASHENIHQASSKHAFLIACVGLSLVWLSLPPNIRRDEALLRAAVAARELKMYQDQGASCVTRVRTDFLIPLRRLRTVPLIGCFLSTGRGQFHCSWNPYESPSHCDTSHYGWREWLLIRPSFERTPTKPPALELESI